MKNALESGLTDTQVRQTKAHWMGNMKKKILTNYYEQQEKWLKYLL